MDMSYTKQESAEIASAYAKLEQWADKQNMVGYLDDAYNEERKQFKGPARNTQARASILRVAYDAMFNENEPVKPSTIFMRVPLAVVYLAISHRIAGWQDRSDYGDKLEKLAEIRVAVYTGAYVHNIAWDRYWEKQLKAPAFTNTTTVASN